MTDTAPRVIVRKGAIADTWMGLGSRSSRACKD